MEPLYDEHDGHMEPPQNVSGLHVIPLQQESGMYLL